MSAETAGICDSSPPTVWRASARPRVGVAIEGANLGPCASGVRASRRLEANVSASRSADAGSAGSWAIALAKCVAVNASTNCRVVLIFLANAVFDSLIAPSTALTDARVSTSCRRRFPSRLFNLSMRCWASIDSSPKSRMDSKSEPVQLKFEAMKSELNTSNLTCGGFNVVSVIVPASVKISNLAPGHSLYGTPAPNAAKSLERVVLPE